MRALEVTHGSHCGVSFGLLLVLFEFIALKAATWLREYISSTFRRGFILLYIRSG